MANKKRSSESRENVDSKLHSFEQTMEIGHEESGPSELTFEQLEHKFQEEIMTLINEQGDLEDEEIARGQREIRRRQHNVIDFWVVVLCAASPVSIAADALTTSTSTLIRYIEGLQLYAVVKFIIC